MAYALITSEDLKQTSKGTFGADFDYLLDKIIIPAVGKLFASYCGRPDFDRAARTVYLSPRPCQKTVFLASPPIIEDPAGNPAIPAVQLWESSALPRAYTSAELLVNSTDYIVHEAEGMLESTGYFVGGAKSLKCTYTGGYLTADGKGTPADLRLAAIAQTKIIFDRREELGVSSRSQEGGAMTMLTVLTLPRQVTIMLDPYRLLRV